MEVIYTGQRQTADQVAVTAAQEDADVVGLSFLAGDHMVLVPKVIQKLKEQSKEDAVLLVGGIILKRHEPELLRMGVAKVFYAGTDPNEIVKYVKENVSLRD